MATGQFGAHYCVHTSLTWFQFFLEPLGSFFHLFTSSTQALQISPTRSSDNLWENEWMKSDCKSWSWCIHFIFSSYTNTHARKTQYRRVIWMNEWERLPKTEPERLLISTAVCEAWAGGLGLADATAVVTPVDLWLVEAKHSLLVGWCYGKKSGNGKQSSVMSALDVCRQLCFLLPKRGRSLHARTHIQTQPRHS